MKLKPWMFLLVSTLILAGILAIHAASQTREDEIRELEREADEQLQQLREAREQLDKAAERLDDLENMLLNLRQMERIISGLAMPSRGGRQLTVATMPLSTPSGYTAERFERAFAGTALAGIGEALVLAEMETGVNALILAGIIVHETGWGNSRLARDKHNLAGLGAYDSREYSCGIAFDSRSDCIMYLAQLLRNRSGTLEEIGRWYASDPAWARKVAGCIKTIVQKSEVRT